MDTTLLQASVNDCSMRDPLLAMQPARAKVQGKLMMGLLSCLVSASASANLQITETSVRPASSASIGWTTASKQSGNDIRASRIMNNDSDEDDSPNLTVDIRRLPASSLPTSRGGALSNLVGRVTGGDLQSSGEQQLDQALSLNANAALVMDSDTGEVLYGKNVDSVRPIASITKLMTAMVTLDARLPMDEQITLQPEDFIGPKRASSSLRVYQTYNRAELLLLALMHSENPAAAALARTYDKGRSSFMNNMNAKAKSLGMHTAFFGDPTGLDNRNAASARDLAKLVKAAYQYEVIRRFTTTAEHEFVNDSGILRSKNTNALVREGRWDIGLSKTGHINEAGHCVVMEASVNRRPTVIVLLDAQSSQVRTGDANRIMDWLGNAFRQVTNIN